MSDLRAIVDEGALSKFLGSATRLDFEARLNVEENGLRITLVDPGNVASVKTMIGLEGFESFDVDDRYVIGANLERLEEAVSFADSGSPVALRTKDAHERGEIDGATELGGFLQVETDGIEHDIVMIDVESVRAEPSIPNLELPASVTLEGSTLDRAVKAVDTVTDHIRLAVDADEEVFRVSGEGDTDSVEVEIPEDELITSTIAEADSLFSLDYMKDLVQPIPADAEVQIQLGEEFPTKMKWGHADGAGSVVMLLAPRVKAD